MLNSRGFEEHFLVPVLAFSFRGKSTGHQGQAMASFGGINRKRMHGSAISSTQKRIKICVYDKPPRVEPRARALPPSARARETGRGGREPRRKGAGSGVIRSASALRALLCRLPDTVAAAAAAAAAAPRGGVRASTEPRMTRRRLPVHVRARLRRMRFRCTSSSSLRSTVCACSRLSTRPRPRA